MERSAWVCDSVDLQRDTGWQPRFNVDTGIADTVAWYREHRWIP